MGSPTNYTSSPGGGTGGAYHAAPQGAFLPAYLMGEQHPLSSVIGIFEIFVVSDLKYISDHFGMFPTVLTFPEKTHP